MTIAITGAAGHLGGNLVRALLAEGRGPLRALVHDDHDSLEGLDIEKVNADVRDPESLRRGFEGAEVVYHLAGRISITGSQGGLVEATNIDGARNAAEAALACGVKRYVHFSSIHAFDLSDTERTVDETNPRATPKHPAYDRSKNAGEREVRRVVERGLDAVIVHPVGCIGPWDLRPSRMGKVFLDVFHRKLPSAIDGGFHWVDTRDIAKGAMAAEKLGRTGESYILSGRWASTPQLFEIAEGITGVKPPRFTTPIWVAAIGAPFMTWYAQLTKQEPLYTDEALHALKQSRKLSIAKAREELGFEPRPLEETVADVYGWFAEHGRITLDPKG